MCIFRGFRSTNHAITAVQMSKLCLCAFKDNRYILDDGIRTCLRALFAEEVNASARLPARPSLLFSGNWEKTERAAGVEYNRK